MKIGFLVDEIAPGSAPVLVGKTINFINKFTDNKAEAIIIKRNKFIHNDENYIKHFKNIRIRYLEDNFPNFFKRNLKFPFMSFFSLNHVIALFFAHKSIKKNEFDIILSFCQYSCFASINLKILRNIPYYTLLWDPSTFIANKIYKKKFNKLFYIFFLTACYLLEKINIIFSKGIILTAKNHILYFKKITKKPIKIIPLGSKINPVKNFKHKRNNDILMFDRWDIGNNPTRILNILKNLKNNVNLIIGGYWYPESLGIIFKETVDSMNLNKRVKIVGGLDDSLIERYAVSSKLYVHLIHDAFGMQVLECASCGCPSAIIENSGVIELFEENESIISLQNDEKKITVILDNFFKNVDFQKKLSINSFQVAVKNDYKNFVFKLLDTLIK